MEGGCGHSEHARAHPERFDPIFVVISTPRAELFVWRDPTSHFPATQMFGTDFCGIREKCDTGKQCGALEEFVGNEKRMKFVKFGDRTSEKFGGSWKLRKAGRWQIARGN